MPQFDKYDKQIIRILQEDAKQTHKDVAAKLGLSLTATYERIRRLEKLQVIEKYVAIINREKVGQSLTVFCEGTLKEQKLDKLKDFERMTLEFEEIKECYYTTGSSDFLLKIVMKDMPSYQHFLLSKLSRIPNVKKLQSTIIMSEIKHETAVNIE